MLRTMGSYWSSVRRGLGSCPTRIAVLGVVCRRWRQATLRSITSLALLRSSNVEVVRLLPRLAELTVCERLPQALDREFFSVGGPCSMLLASVA